ncbi:integrase catalytic domain-containing protein [Trichonephila clavipes]|nr:integrase catalytic domain-containing protein [Trichonephila clavipes]
MQHLKSLSTFTDSNGILRIKTKLIMREDDENFKFPLVLSSDHHVVKSLILYKHQELGHPGVQSSVVGWFLGEVDRTVKKNFKKGLRSYIFGLSGNRKIESVLCDCESLQNSRPLTYVSDDPNDLCPLTPDLFLKEIRNSSTRDLDRIKFPDKTELNKQLAYRRRLKLCPLELDVWQVVNKSRETIDPGGNSERLDCVPTIPDYVPIVPDSVSTVPDSDVRTTRSARNIRTPNRYRT